MSHPHDKHDDVATLDRLIGEINADTRGDDEALRAFRDAFEWHITVPADALVMGEPVSVRRFDYDGNARRGVTATCHRHDGSEHVIAAADVVLTLQTTGER